MNGFKDIWKDPPPIDEEILFATGDGIVHFGCISNQTEKLRKCSFRCFQCHIDYDCDSQTEYSERVLFWGKTKVELECQEEENVED